MTCDMVRRKTKEASGRMVCRACQTPFPPGKNGLKCRKCHEWACNAACGRAVADLRCCLMSGVPSHESQSQSCSQKLGSRAAEGTPRLMQGMEQAMDVQLADVQRDQQPSNERVAFRAALQVVPTTLPAMSIAPIEVERQHSRCRVDMASPHAGSRAVQKPRIPPQRSAGPKSSYWSWRRRCRPCEPSGTSHGGRGKGRANTTRIAVTNGLSDVTQSPSKVRLLQPDGPGWVPRCLCGLMRAAIMRMTMD